MDFQLTPFRNVVLGVCIVGLLIFLLCPASKTRIVRTGEIMFGIGLFCFLFGK